MALTEEWRPVPGSARYLVSGEGRVAKTLKPRRSLNGYLRIAIDDHDRGVHQVVAAAFIGPRPGTEDVHHVDGDRANNRAANLRYLSRSDNNRARQRTGRPPVISERTVRAIRRMHARTRSPLRVAGRFGVSEAYVGLLSRRKARAGVS